MSPIRYAVAAALVGAASTAAHALDISAYAGNAATNVNVYISGSTAVDNTLLNTEISIGGNFNGTTVPVGICAANTIDVYQIGGPTERLTYCTASATAGVTAGTPIAIFKESNIGSVNGVSPLLAAVAGTPTGVYYLDPSKFTDSNCAAGTTTNGATFFSTYTLHANCNGNQSTTNNLIPTGGVADVEANVLRTPAGASLSASTVTADLNVAAGLDVLWGVGVTKNLYYALQAAEGLGAGGTKVASCTTANNDAPACAPSLSKEQVTSLYTGNSLFSWNQLLNLNNAVDNNVYICRRDTGSGTQASFEQYFMGARCGGAATAMAAEDGAFTFASGGTGGVRSCFAVFQNGGTVTPFNPAFPPVGFPGGEWAIGVLSSEVSSGNLNPDVFRMIAVDGVLPTIENAQNGFTPYFSTDAFYVIKPTKNNAPAANPLAVFNAIQGEIGHPGFTALSNTAFAGRPWGNGGDLAPAALFQPTFPPTIPATAATAAINPTNTYTKNNGGIAAGAVNNCNPPQLFDNTVTSVNTPAPSVLLGNGNVNN